MRVVRAGPQTRSRLRAGRERMKKIGSARMWILILAICYAAFGTVFGLMQSKEADTVHRFLADRPDTDLWVEKDDGKEVTIGELKAQIDAEVRLTYVTHYVLAAIMLGLFFWARRAPLPAMVTALGVYLVVQVLSAVLDPTSIFKGIIIKVFFILALIAGMKAALAQRASAERGTRPLPGTGRAA